MLFHSKKNKNKKIKDGVFQVALMVKNPPINAGDVRDVGSIPGLRRPLEESVAMNSSYSAREIPWTEEPGGL